MLFLESPPLSSASPRFLEKTARDRRGEKKEKRGENAVSGNLAAGRQLHNAAAETPRRHLLRPGSSLDVVWHTGEAVSNEVVGRSV